MARAAFLLAVTIMLIASARSFLPNESSLVGSGAALAVGFALIAALQAGTIFSGLRLPRLTGYLVLGFIAGPSVFGWLTERMLLDLKLVNNVAVGLIALAAGAELNLRRLRPRLRAIFAVTMVSLPFTMLLTGGFLLAIQASPFADTLLGFMHGMTWPERLSVVLVMSVVLASLSPMVNIALLTEAGAKGPYAEMCLGIVIVADIVILFAFAASNAVAGRTFGAAAGTDLQGLLVHIFGSIVLGFVLALVLLVYLKTVNRRVALFVFVVCFTCAEAGSKLHLDPLLACLSAGIFLENLTDLEGEKLVRDMEPARLPVFAVFFAVAGASLHWHAFREVAVVALVLAALRAIALFIGSRIGASLGGVQASHRPFIASCMYPQSGISIGLCVLVERQFPTWGKGASAALFGAVMLAELFGPIAFRRAIIAVGESAPRGPTSSGPAEAPASAESH